MDASLVGDPGHGNGGCGGEGGWGRVEGGEEFADYALMELFQF